MKLEEIFKKIEGKRIAWYTWKETYFIPEKLVKIYHHHDNESNSYITVEGTAVSSYDKFKTVYRIYMNTLCNKGWIILDKQILKTHLPDFL